MNNYCGKNFFLNFESQLILSLEIGDHENKWEPHNDALGMA